VRFANAAATICYPQIGAGSAKWVNFIPMDLTGLPCGLSRSTGEYNRIRAGNIGVAGLMRIAALGSAWGRYEPLTMIARVVPSARSDSEGTIGVRRAMEKRLEERACGA